MRLDLDNNVMQEALSIWNQLAPAFDENGTVFDRYMYIQDDVLSKLSSHQRGQFKAMVDHFLHQMREAEASDIDLGGAGCNGQIWLRIMGEKKPVLNTDHLPTAFTDLLIQSLLTAQQLNELSVNKSIDFSYAVKRLPHLTERYRASAYFDLDGLSINMRAINVGVRKLETYDLHPAVLNALSLETTKEGLVLVTGITGSGKTTTLDAIVDYSNQRVPGHIVIIGSPIEYIHHSHMCIVRHREVGNHVTSFKAATIEALRQDPDAIVVGEMRDPDTIMAVLETADSGHKVFSTLHTYSAVDSIARILGEVPMQEQERIRLRLADLLRCVISQKLVPAKDGKRLLVKEVLLRTPSVGAAIKNGNISEIYQMISEGSEKGMISMEQDLHRLHLEGKITVETALNYANNKRRMQQLLYNKIFTYSP